MKNWDNSISIQSKQEAFSFVKCRDGKGGGSKLPVGRGGVSCEWDWGKGGENRSEDRERPHGTSSFQRPPFVTPFPGKDKGTSKSDTISIQFVVLFLLLFLSFFLFFLNIYTILILKNKLIFPLRDKSLVWKRKKNPGRQGKCSPHMLQAREATTCDSTQDKVTIDQQQLSQRTQVQKAIRPNFQVIFHAFITGMKGLI